MYNGIGLTTVRGSATSGHVTKNLSYVKPDQFRNKLEHNRGKFDDRNQADRPRVNEEIMEHNRRRGIEAKVYEMRHSLQGQGIDAEEVEKHCLVLRCNLETSGVSSSHQRLGKGVSTDTHDTAARKERDNARIKAAFGICDKSEACGYGDQRAVDDKVQGGGEHDRAQPRSRYLDRGDDRRHARQSRDAELKDDRRGDRRVDRIDEDRRRDGCKQRDKGGGWNGEGEGDTSRGRPRTRTTKEEEGEVPEPSPPNLAAVSVAKKRRFSRSRSSSSNRSSRSGSSSCSSSRSSNDGYTGRDHKKGKSR